MNNTSFRTTVAADDAVIQDPDIYKYTGQVDADYRDAFERAHEGKSEEEVAQGLKALENTAPADVVINGSEQSIIIGAEAYTGQRDSRVDPGERRRGSFYVELMPIQPGLMLVKDTPQKTLDRLDKMRQQNSGQMAPDWVLDARKQQAREGVNDITPEQRAYMTGYAADQVKAARKRV